MNLSQELRDLFVGLMDDWKERERYVVNDFSGDIEGDLQKLANKAAERLLKFEALIARVEALEKKDT